MKPFCLTENVCKTFHQLFFMVSEFSNCFCSFVVILTEKLLHTVKQIAHGKYQVRIQIFADHVFTPFSFLKGQSSHFLLSLHFMHTKLLSQRSTAVSRITLIVVVIG
jgi:hypothetical protein